MSLSLARVEYIAFTINFLLFFKFHNLLTRGGMIGLTWGRFSDCDD